MKKLSLNPDHLEVQSFETDMPVRARGTVRANATAVGGIDTCALYCTTVTGSLSACGCETGDCTGNAGEVSCYNSYDFCKPTQRPLRTCPHCYP